MPDLLQIAPLPLATQGLPLLVGQIKTQPEDFEVEEIPAYIPSGVGEFLYLWVEKKGLSGPFLAKALSRDLKVSPKEIGMAGFKDRHAVTRQWISLPARVEMALANLNLPGFRILQTARHGNKLRTGHLHGNRFKVLLRTQDPDASQKMARLLEKLKQTGLRNFYGEQRFGKGQETLAGGLGLVLGIPGPRMPGHLLKLAYSAVQSALFNEVLRERINLEIERKVIPGDVLAFLPQEKCCSAVDLERDQVRVNQGAMAITGPMPGWKMHPSPQEEALVLEQRVIGQFGFTPECWRQAGRFMTGARRPLSYPLSDIQWEKEVEGIRLSFTLPAGTYATQLLREIREPDENNQGEY
ncbi:MAG: tRNA pseudouridine(13) synthase TruD [Gemmataceae bacterium]|nr:tRNA pseudouridine(13) synthase TruD [Gemmataceae bacterium]